MPRSSSSDTRYLETHGREWRVVLSVPRGLQPKLGTKLKRPLHTDSLAIANRLKWQAIAELQAVIEQARKGRVDARDPLTREALAMAATRARAVTSDEVALLDRLVYDRADEIMGDPVETEPGAQGEAVYIYDPDREQEAATYAALARGEATPIALHHEQFIAQGHTKVRTQADDRRALKFLLEWCEANRIQPMLQSFTRKVGLRFMDDLADLAGTPNPVTLNKYQSRLSTYWNWLLHREIVTSNPWQGLKLTVPKPVPSEEERSFTDDEVRKLLSVELTRFRGQ